MSGRGGRVTVVDMDDRPPDSYQDGMGGGGRVRT